MPRHSYDGDASQAARWKRFEDWLTDRVFTLEPFDYLIVSEPHGSYVQVIHSYQGRLVAEAHVGESPAPKAWVITELERLGWGAPGAGDYPNWRTFWVPTDWNPHKLPVDGPQWISVADAREVAALLAATLHAALSVESTGDLDVDTGNTEEDRDAYWVAVHPDAAV
jgi:hypothetical protein